MTRKSAFGRAHCSIRALRGMTIADAAADAGISNSAIALAEIGKQRVDTRLATALVEVCALSIDERMRLADGWAQSGIDGDAVRYDVKPGSEAGYRGAALLAMFARDLSDGAWTAICEIVNEDLAVRDEVAA